MFYAELKYIHKHLYKVCEALRTNQAGLGLRSAECMQLVQSHKSEFTDRVRTNMMSGELLDCMCALRSIRNGHNQHDGDKEG